MKTGDVITCARGDLNFCIRTCILTQEAAKFLSKSMDFDLLVSPKYVSKHAAT